MTSVSEAVEEYHRSSLRRENFKKQSIIQRLQWGKLRFTRRSFRIIPNLHSYVNLTCLILGFSTTGLVIFDILWAATSRYFRSSPGSSRPTVFACKFRWSWLKENMENIEIDIWWRMLIPEGQRGWVTETKVGKLLLFQLPPDLSSHSLLKSKSWGGCLIDDEITCLTRSTPRLNMARQNKNLENKTEGSHNEWGDQLNLKFSMRSRPLQSSRLLLNLYLKI